MKQLDTHTVLEIIKMIDKYSSAAYTNIEEAIEKGEYASPYDIGVFDQMSELSDHLQSFIEAQLNAVENSTGE